jgi:hypothetical protein
VTKAEYVVGDAKFANYPSLGLLYVIFFAGTAPLISPRYGHLDINFGEP